MILTNLPITHIRNGAAFHSIESYKSKASTDFITKRFIEKEKLKEKNQLNELNKYKQLFRNTKNTITTTINTTTKSFIKNKTNNNILSPGFTPKFTPGFTPKFTPRFTPGFTPGFTSKFNVKPIVSSFSNILSTSQTKKCGNISNENAILVHKINKLKAKTIQKTLKKTVKKPLNIKSNKNNIKLKNLKLEIEKDKITKNEFIKFEKQRQKQITEMINEMFPKQKINKTQIIPKQKPKNKYFKSMHGKDKFVIKTKLFSDSLNKWNISFKNLINMKKMIFGIQIIGKNGKINTIYSNESGMIFINKKPIIINGLKIKNKLNISISIKYTNYNEIIIYFHYFKNEKLFKTNNKPIIITDLNAFEFGVNAKVFIGQTNGHGNYTMIHQN